MQLSTAIGPLEDAPGGSRSGLRSAVEGALGSSIRFVVVIALGQSRAVCRCDLTNQGQNLGGRGSGGAYTSWYTPGVNAHKPPHGCFCPTQPRHFRLSGLR